MADAFGVGVGIHPQRNRLVTMAQRFGYAGHICPVGNRHACEGVAQLVGVKIRQPAALG